MVVVTLQGILLYLAVGYFLDRVWELTDFYEAGPSDGHVMAVRYGWQFAWPGMVVVMWVAVATGVVYHAGRACWAVLRTTRHRAAARST